MQVLRFWWVPLIAAAIIACSALAAVQFEAWGAVAPKDANDVSTNLVITIGEDSIRNYDYYRSDEAHPADPAKTGDKSYSTEIDWPVTILFVNAATVSRVFDRFEWKKLSGSTLPLLNKRWFRRTVYTISPHTCWGRVRDNGRLTETGFNAKKLYDPVWDGDKGRKYIRRSYIPGIRRPIFYHFRVYAPNPDNYVEERGYSFDRMYTPTFGYYVICTTHMDYEEWLTGSAWAGKSEKIADYMAEGYAYKYRNEQTPDGKARVVYDVQAMKNKPAVTSTSGKHRWQCDGNASRLRIYANEPNY